MSLVIGADTKPDRERVLDKAVYDDVDDMEVTKRNESLWDRQEGTRHERHLDAVEDVNQFVPVHVDGAEAVGLSFPTAMAYKNLLCNRECMQFIQQWRTALVRCVTKTQWKIVVERYMSRVKACPAFLPALRVVLEDRELVQVQEALPEERDPEDRRKRIDGDMERDKVHWVMDCNFPLTDNCPEALQSPLKRGQVLKSCYKKLTNSKRAWKTVQHFTYLDSTYPALAYSATHGTCVVRQVTKTVLQITYQSRSFFVTEETGHGLLSCCISPNGTLLAICNELCIYVIDVKESTKVRRLSMDQKMIITAMDLTDTELVYGTVHGHVHRIDLKRNKSLLKTWISDKVAITQVVRSGSKTVVQTIGSIYLVESDFQGPEQMIQINTWRPMCLAVRGGKILVLNKSGVLFLFSTVVREMFVEVPPPEGFHVTVDVGMPWYKGVHIDKGTQRLTALFPDGQLREIVVHC